MIFTESLGKSLRN